MADQPAGDEPIIKEPEAPAQTPDIAMAIIGSAGYCWSHNLCAGLPAKEVK